MGMHLLTLHFKLAILRCPVKDYLLDLVREIFFWVREDGLPSVKCKTKLVEGSVLPLVNFQPSSEEPTIRL